MRIKRGSDLGEKREEQAGVCMYWYKLRYKQRKAEQHILIEHILVSLVLASVMEEVTEVPNSVHKATVNPLLAAKHKRGF